jgi:FkbM family methyltransferase
MGLSTLPAGVRFGYQGGRKHWRVCVFEPNLCMVKTSIIPMLVCEEAYRQKPPFAEIFRFCNTYKSKDNQSFVRFAQSLDIVKNGLSSFDNRFHYYEFMAHHGDCVVSHQWHNAQNYLYYETLHGGYPLVHNSPILKDVGYYYPDFDCRAGGEALIHAHETHDTSLEEYKARASGFLETLGITYTPNIEAYRSALLGLFTPNSSSLPEQILQAGGESAAQPGPAAAETELAADESGLTKTEGRHGTFFIAKSDSYVGRSLELYGEWAEAEIFLFSQIVKKGDIVVEAGANIGAHTIPLSRMCGNGTVHAFEPQPFVFSLLQRNVAVNMRRNVRIWNSALGATLGRAPMPLLHPDGENPVNFGAASLHDTDPVRSDGTPWEKVPVSVMALDDIEDIPQLDFLKTDAEGFDFQVLQGAIGKIRRCRPAIFVESISHHGDITDAVNSLLGELGYSTWHFNTHLFNPDNHKKSTHNIFARMASFDVLCLPAEKFKVEGLESASRPVPVLPTDRFPDDYWKKVRIRTNP